MKMFVARTVAAAIVASAVVSSAAHAAQGAGASATPVQKPFGQLTCEDFLLIEDQNKPRVVYWAIAYAMGRRREEIIVDINGLDKLAPIIVDECGKAPKASLWQKVEAEWRKIEFSVRNVEQKVTQTP